MSAAFALTNTEALRQRFEVTIYQYGWRLGGKGASGRNARYGQRIEEHGLHMWLGFYDHAFRSMRACYEEWGKVPFQQAFTPEPQISLAERVREGDRDVWKSWNISPFVLPGVPGTRRPPLLLELLEGLVKGLLGAFEHGLAHDRGSTRHQLLQHAQGMIASAVRDNTGSRGVPDEVLHALERAHHETHAVSGKEGLADTIRHAELLVDLGLAGARGFIRDILPYGESGYDRINYLEFRDWLRLHGASERAVQSAPIRALYDLGFSYVRGATSEPSAAQAAAGVTLRVNMHMAFGCRGSVLWKMHAGMGDTVFSPFYEVLRQRGVRFRFFHRVKALRVSSSGRLVTSIEMDRQVDVNDGPETYRPLVDVKGLPCWPSEPDWSQIVDGTAIAARLASRHITLETASCDQCVGKETLTFGRDFDYVVVALSLAPLAEVCRELVAASDRWQAMVDNIRTVATQAFQLWTRATLPQLGWTAGPTVMTSFAEPYDSWADMSHLIPAEDWPDSAGVRGIHYFCGALSDEQVGRAPDPFPRAEDIARKNAAGTLRQNIGAIWPGAVGPDGFRWDLLVDPFEESGSARFDRQFFRANVDPSERYVLSVPGSVRYRLRPGDSDFDNVVLAGDWTRTQLNSGCVEAAMESGLLAARALADGPSEE